MGAGARAILGTVPSIWALESEAPGLELLKEKKTLISRERTTEELSEVCPSPFLMGLFPRSLSEPMPSWGWLPRPTSLRPR